LLDTFALKIKHLFDFLELAYDGVVYLVTHFQTLSLHTIVDKITYSFLKAAILVVE